MSQFALLKYGATANLGDEIQSLAAAAFLPRVDLMLDRDKPDVSAVNSSTKIIVNGVFSHSPMSWPLYHEQLEPLFISLHLSRPELMEPPLWRYLEQHAPIGCRDLYTLEMVREKGIAAYFSGCLTLTLERPCVEREDLICFVDPFGSVPGYRFPRPGEPDFRRDLWEIFPEEVRKRACYYSHHTASRDAAWKFQRARELLDIYARAKFVVTGRLHAALPCLAFGTPVVFLCNDRRHRRFPGLLELMNVCSLRDLAQGKLAIDWEAPPENRADLREIQQLLRERCSAFTAAG